MMKVILVTSYTGIPLKHDWIHVSCVNRVILVEMLMLSAILGYCSNLANSCLCGIRDLHMIPVGLF